MCQIIVSTIQMVVVVVVAMNSDKNTFKMKRVHVPGAVYDRMSRRTFFAKVVKTRSISHLSKNLSHGYLKPFKIHPQISQACPRNVPNNLPKIPPTPPKNIPDES